MATYRNKNDKETIYYPADFKLLISMDPIDGHTLGGKDGVDFQCTFIVGSKKIILDKEHMFQNTPKITNGKKPLMNSMMPAQKGTEFYVGIP
jgi:hypothetical protein